MGKKSKTKPPKPPKDASAAGSGTIAARGTSEAAQRRAAVAAAARAGQPIQVPDLSGLRLISAEVVAALGGEGTRTTIEDVEKAEAGLAWAEKTDALRGVDWFGVVAWVLLVGGVSFSSPSRYAMADAWDPRFTGWGGGVRYR